VIFIPYKKKKSTRKWNRTHYFVNEKKTGGSDREKKEHPALIFEKSGNQLKPIVFTHSETTDGKQNVRLKFNVDPDDSKPCYAVPYRAPRRSSEFQPPKKNYRIHKDDYETVKTLRIRNKKK
jgi:hypothetical protein